MSRQHSKHIWELAESQESTGTHGVRLVCATRGAFNTHYLTVHSKLLERYL